MSELTNALLADVAALIKTSSTDVQKRVVNLLTERELNSRVELLDVGLIRRGELQQAVSKINRADIETYDAEGNPVSSSYSKQRLQELKTAKEKLDKLDRALEKALAGDFDELKKQLK